MSPFDDDFPRDEGLDEEPSLFNIAAIGADVEEMIWASSERDCVALIGCGFDNVVALPGDCLDSDLMRRHEKVLTRVKRHVLAFAMDKAGLDMREEVARRLGRQKCMLVDWPEGCVTGHDTQCTLGQPAVATALWACRPYPIEGIHWVTADCLLALRERPAPQVMSTGTRATDAILSLPAEGRLIVVTGYPACGKTSWLRYVMVHTAKTERRKWGVFSPEMMPWEQFAADCAEVLIGKPFWMADGKRMDEDETRRAGQWLETKMAMLVADSEEEAPTLDWLLTRASALVLQFGMTDFLIDPWNEMDHSRERGVTETDFIGRSLQRIKAWIHRHGCNVWIIAHPAKPFGIKPGEAKPPPGPYEIASSAHWNNKPDLGITIHSTASGQAELHVWKARFRRFGQRGTMAEMTYDRTCGKYSSPELNVAPADGMSGMDYND